MDIRELIQQETHLCFRKATVQEYAGPCPFCKAGDNRFRLWPHGGRYWCRVCGRKGDAIQFLKDYKHFTFAQAKEYLAGEGCRYVGSDHKSHNYHNYDNNDTHHSYTPLRPSPAQMPPTEQWQDAACDFVFDCTYNLLGSDKGERALAWLHQRTLTDLTLQKFRLGYNPTDLWIERAAWGLPSELNGKGQDKKLWLPRGIVIPWFIGGDLWGIRIRRPQGDPKYYWIPGGTPSLYNADMIAANQPAILVEGEIDALTNIQAANEIAASVATGSTTGARRPKWSARLATASIVLVAYDTDAAGEKAAQFWLDKLPNARRWRPYWDDVNGMAQSGVNIQNWISAGVSNYLSDHN